MPSPPLNAPEWAILDLLLAVGGRSWTVEELAHEVGSLARAADALASLEAARLIRQSGGFVRLTQTASADAASRQEAPEAPPSRSRSRRMPR